MSDPEIDLLRRKLAELESLANNALAVATLAQQRYSELRADLEAHEEKTDARFRGLTAKAQVIVDIDG